MDKVSPRDVCVVEKCSMNFRRQMKDFANCHCWPIA